MSISVPIMMRRRGNEARIIVGSSDQQDRAPDPTLVALVARAHLYLAAITERIGTKHYRHRRPYDVHPADISRVLPLVFLAPSITETILTGGQPAELSARHLARLGLRMLWTELANSIQA